MTGRNHLILDGIGQACIIIYYAFLLTKSAETIVLLQLFVITLAGWQFVNAVLSYKFFERQSKKLYVRVAGLSWLVVVGLLGLLIVSANFLIIFGLAGLGDYVLTAFDWFQHAMWIVFPAVLGALACWYLYLTIKDINIILNKTI